jgi:hypothetical protein
VSMVNKMKAQPSSINEMENVQSMLSDARGAVERNKRGRLDRDMIR